MSGSVSRPVTGPPPGAATQSDAEPGDMADHGRVLVAGFPS